MSEISFDEAQRIRRAHEKIMFFQRDPERWPPNSPERTRALERIRDAEQHFYDLIYGKQQ